MAINDWWADIPSECYWMETTERPDIGVDLHGDMPAPGSRPIPGRELMSYTRPGDVVLHWDMKSKRLVGSSIVDSYARTASIAQGRALAKDFYRSRGRAR
jgi:hypothetical protein